MRLSEYSTPQGGRVGETNTHETCASQSEHRQDMNECVFTSLELRVRRHKNYSHTAGAASPSAGERVHEPHRDDVQRRGQARLAPGCRKAASGPQAPAHERERTPTRAGTMDCGPETWVGDKRGSDRVSPNHNRAAAARGPGPRNEKHWAAAGEADTANLRPPSRWAATPTRRCTRRLNGTNLESKGAPAPSEPMVAKQPGGEDEPGLSRAPAKLGRHSAANAPQ